MRNFLLAVITATLLVACCDHHTNPDPCADITCSHGTCQNGSCVCEQDWYGTECDMHFDPSEIGVVYQVFCSSDSGRLEISGITGPYSYLNDYYVDIPVGAVDRCVWFILAPAQGQNLPIPSTGKVVERAHGIEVTAIDKEQPFLADGSGFNTMQLLKEITIFFSQHRAKVLLYMKEDNAYTFLPTEFVPEGTLGQTTHLSEFYLDFGDPIVEATAQHLGNRKVEIDFTRTLDEGSPLPYFLQFSADGDGTPLTLESVDSTGLLYRTTLAGGQHSITATVTNLYGGTGSKQINLTVDLCSGVTCEPWQTCREIDGVCVGNDPCDPDPCNGHGFCSGGTCLCDTHWDPTALCATCVDHWDSATNCTTCVEGWMGVDCNTVDLCYGVSCNGHGSCKPADGTCNCDNHWDSATSCATCTGNWDPAQDCNACLSGYGGANCDPVPTISGLAIDCSGGGWPGHCVAGGNQYPVSFNSTNATSFTVVVTKESGTGTPGSAPNGTITGSTTTFQYTTGSDTLQVNRITVTVYGPGGQATAYILVTLD